jgi:hypothetical protein
MSAKIALVDSVDDAAEALDHLAAEDGGPDGRS